MRTTKHNVVTLSTISEEKELPRIEDEIISAEEARAAAKSSAELSVSTSRLWKIVFGVIALLFLAWLANAGLMVAVVNLSKDLNQTLKVNPTTALTRDLCTPLLPQAHPQHTNPQTRRYP